MRRLRTLVLVAAGGMAGTALRLGLSSSLDGELPVATLVVNLAGSGLAGYLAGRTVSTEIRALLAVGFAGSLTTFSTLMAEWVLLGWWGTLYAAVSIVAGLAMARVGWLSGRAARR